MELARLAPDRFNHVSFSFNRKEAKDHGEGGTIVGGSLKGQRVMIIDDVVTAGTAKKEAIEMIRAEGGQVAGIVIALDRNEKLPADAAKGEDDEDGVPRESAIGALKRELGTEVPIISVLTLNDLIEGLAARGLGEELNGVKAYREKYRASD
jgi:orotate phosphoribosyltransferase